MLIGCLWALPAAAHRLAPSLLDVREQESGRLEVLWKTPLQRPAGVDLRPELPEGCKTLGEPTAAREGTAVSLRFGVECAAGEAGASLVGRRFAVRGLAESGTEAVLRLDLADGREYRAILRGDSAEYVVPSRAEPLRVAWDYLVFGFGHILGGLDHLLFVLALVLLVPDRRMLVWTVSAFTVGHSVTLCLAALGFVSFPTALAELFIAISILWVAVELVRGEARTALARRPWLVAGSFGLLHGLGFASALSEVGLPQEEIPVALLCFNVGIELGQLLFVAATLLVGLALGPWVSRGPAWLRWIPAYAIGTLAAYWCFERAASLL